MKTDRGQLGFVSQLAMAASAGVNAGQADINRQLQALNSGELYTVARLSCFRDHALAKDETYAIRTNSGYRWTDPAVEQPSQSGGPGLSGRSDGGAGPAGL